jgi:hypothetical protein
MVTRGNYPGEFPNTTTDVGTTNRYRDLTDDLCSNSRYTKRQLSNSTTTVEILA